MKSIKTLLCLLIFVAFGGITALPMQAQQEDILPFEIVGENNVRSDWSSPEPGIAIVANPSELTRLYDVIVSNDYQQLRGIDYDRSFAVVLFHGIIWEPQDAQTPAINVEQVQMQGNRVQISATSTLIPLEGDPLAISPYQIIKINKENDWGIESTFALQLDAKEVVTKTHYIPNSDLSFETVELSSAQVLGEGQSLWESEEVGNVVVATSAELSLLQNLVTTETMQTLQAVDYEKQFVIGLFQGKQPTTGYAIEIEQIRHRLGNIEIDALLTEPTENVPATITSPYHIVKLDKMPWWNQEFTFTVSNSDQHLLTQTHILPNNIIEFEWASSGEKYLENGSTPEMIVVNRVEDEQRLRALIEIEPTDYSEYFVIAQFFQFNSGGYSISLNQVRYEENRLLLYHNVSSPFMGEQATADIHSPYQVIRIPRASREWDGEIDVGILINGAQVLAQRHTILPPSEMTTIESMDASGWRSSEPHMEIITSVDDISKVEDFISTEALTALQEIDYREKYAAIIFQGKKPTTEYEIKIERIRRAGDQVVLESVATTPLAGEAAGEEITSPYHLIQVDNLYERGHQIDFVLNINGQHIMTQTRSIPDMLSQPSTLQGNFYPLTDIPGYEIVLENQGQQTAENVRLLVQAEYGSVEYADDWLCDERQLSQECRQDLGQLAPGQIITRTFSFSALPLPLISAARSCAIRAEFEEPMVTAWADNMAVHQLSGTGESVFDTTVQGLPCPGRFAYLPLIMR